MTPGLAPPVNLCVPPRSRRCPPVPVAAHSSHRRFSRRHSAAQLTMLQRVMCPIELLALRKLLLDLPHPESPRYKDSWRGGS
ncbi:hypothetical protein PVAP13_5KG234707 [Panicum virgatum]|uniref:Uncharacterized protein n=1 Tax=Panicum virgatum TaxID=38727 RepID=A0A8T0SHE5_PANVG|nr:hypothetical protein PVAP13_5KG234707 [Panicum virgatum]